jgi:16S rRNA C1402 (ribose-2'-O) methylase RsmI
MFESIKRGKLSELLEIACQEKLRGEYIAVIAGVDGKRAAREEG